MRTSVVTIEDLTKFFSGETGSGDNWTLSEKGNGLEAKSKYYTVSLKPDSAVYNVKIKDKEDPSDSEDGFTEKPIEFIIEFMGTGTTGDEYFKNMASIGPDDLRDILTRLSSEIKEETIGPRKLKRILRRAMIMTDVELVRRIFSSSLRLAGMGDFEVKEISNLRSDMAEKGWRAKVDEDNDGNSILNVDIGDIFEVKVKVDHRLWNYEFRVNGTDIVEKGISDDPIFTFQDFRKSGEVRGARADAKNATPESNEPSSANPKSTLPGPTRPIGKK